MQLPSIFSALLLTLTTSFTTTTAIPLSISHLLNNNPLSAFHHPSNNPTAKRDSTISPSHFLNSNPLSAFQHSAPSNSNPLTTQCRLHLHQRQDRNGSNITDAQVYDSSNKLAGNTTGPSRLDSDFVVRGLHWGVLIETLDLNFNTVTYGNAVRFTTRDPLCEASNSGSGTCVDDCGWWGKRGGASDVDCSFDC